MRTNSIFISHIEFTFPNENIQKFNFCNKFTGFINILDNAIYNLSNQIIFWLPESAHWLDHLSIFLIDLSVMYTIRSISKKFSNSLLYSVPCLENRSSVNQSFLHQHTNFKDFLCYFQTYFMFTWTNNEKNLESISEKTHMVKLFEICIRNKRKI